MKKTTIYRRPMGENLFEEELTVEALSEMGNPLERLSKRVDFEMFRPILEDALLTKDVKSAAGRKPIDVVLMFKVIFATLHILALVRNRARHITTRHRYCDA